MPRKSNTVTPNSPAKRGEVTTGAIDASAAVRMLSREMTPMALQTLQSICLRSKNDSARASAAKEILDRGWGKTRIEALDNNDKPDTKISIVFGADHQPQTIDATATDVDDDE